MHIKKISMARLEQTPLWFAVFSFVDRDSRTRMIAMEAARALDGRAVLTEMVNLGARDVPSDEAGRKLLAERISGMSTKQKGRLVIAGGWVGKGRNRFVFRGEVITGAERLTARRPVFVASTFDAAKGAHLLNEYPATGDGIFGERGRIDGWDKTVGKTAAFSSAAMLSIGLAYTAPTLRLQRHCSLAVNFVGPSSTGKTSTVLAGGSVAGLGSADALSDLNVTEAYVGDLAVMHRDQILLLDDISTVRGSDRDRFQMARYIAYNAAGRGERGRSRYAQKQVTGRHDGRSTNRLILLTSSEHCLRDLALMAGQRIDGGQEVRMLEIPVCTPGSEGIFDRLPEDIATDDRRALAARLADDLRAGARRHQGMKIRAWLELLVREEGRDDRLAFMRKCREAFMRWAKPADARQGRHAKHFAVIYAAGALAIKEGQLPWPRELYRDAVRTCYLGSRDQMSAPGEEVQEGVEAFLEWVHNKARTGQWPARGSKEDQTQFDGWWRETNDGRFLMLRKDRAKDRFGPPDNWPAIEGRLVMDGIIVVRQQGEYAKLARVPGLTKRTQLYLIALPGAAKNV